MKLPVPPKTNRATSVTVSSWLPPSFRLRPAGFKVPGALKAPLMAPVGLLASAQTPRTPRLPAPALAPICPGMDGSRFNFKLLAGNELGAWPGSRKTRQTENATDTLHSRLSEGSAHPGSPDCSGSAAARQKLVNARATAGSRSCLLSCRIQHERAEGAVSSLSLVEDKADSDPHAEGKARARPAPGY